MDTDVDMEVTLAEGVGGYRHRSIEKWTRVGDSLQSGFILFSFF